MSSELVRREERITTASLFADPARYEVLRNASAVMFSGGAGVGLVPSCFKNPQQVFAGMLMLVGMGEDPLAGIQAMHPLPGNKLGIDYKFLIGVVERNAPGWRYEVEKQTDDEISGWFQASESHPKYRLTYTYAQAVKSGVTKNGIWDAHRETMMFKTWWLKGARRTAAAALRGVPVQYDAEPDENDDAPSSPAATLVPSAPVEAPAVAPVPAVAPTDAAGGAAADYQTMFLDLATKAGFQVRGRGNGQKAHRLLVEVLTDEGIAPTFKSTAEVAPADWRRAYERLDRKYGSGAEVVVEDAGNAGGTTPTPAAATDAAPASEGPDELFPPDDEPGGSMSDMAAEEDEKAIIEEQMKTLDYLTAISRDLEKAWKQPESVIRADKRGRLWFTNRDILLTCGYKDEKGASVPKALFTEGVNDSKWVLAPHEIYALSLQVQKALATVQNGGKPTEFQQQT